VSELPAGWVSASIGEICSQGEQRIPEADEQFTYIDIASVDRGRKTVVGPQLLRGYEAPSRARKVVATGDVIVSMTRPNLNAVALIGQRHDSAIASTGFDVLRPIEVDPRWIFAAVKSAHFVKAMSAKVQGALYPAIKADDIRKHEIPLPPLAEQKRIAQKLDALLAQVDTLKARIDAIPALLKRFRQAVLAAATSGQPTEKLITQDGTTWKLTTIGEVCSGSFYGPRFGKTEYTELEEGIPTIRTTDMTDDGRIIISPATPRVLVPTEKRSKFLAKKGDLLVTRTGSIGVMAVFDGDYEAIPSAYLIRFRFKPEIVPRYVFFCLMSPRGQASLGLSATAITQPNINAEAVKAIEIRIPSIEEQTKIICRVEQLFAYADQLEAKVVAAQQRINALTQSLLAKAFRGELVPQDPTDEPASVLLERIRAQRAATPKPKRGRKAATD